MPPRPAPLTNRGDQVDQPPQSHEAGDLWFLELPPRVLWRQHVTALTR
jgi:hypothetical protein